MRGNKNGKGIIPFYGFASALAMDPIEKKPLYHFRPGSEILSLGFAGCNLRCPFCQNWRISQNTDIEGRWLQPGDVISAVLRETNAGSGCSAIAYTYSEPLVHAEFLLDCMPLAHRHGIANVLVTNGCVNIEAAREILALTDAANIDLKCFSAATYSKVLGGGASTSDGASTYDAMETVLEFIALAHKTGVHVELTTLVVPGLNDSDEELDRCADFIAGLNGASALAEIPWHLSAYHPDYHWNAPPTDPAFLLRTAERARKKLRYVYTGNIAAEENNTLCPHCGAALVRRRAYRVDTGGLAPPANGERMFRCASCGEKIAIST
ncbi:AmmeMemoRadiSam system radical SAM enzyme [Spirochaetia bacterium]|nr:AmmeMemoRadiSam system radical SAM enzyme [Spirochaetia bacterium]